jgi:hypothetical protein
MMKVSHKMARTPRQEKVPAFPPDLCVTDRRETGRDRRQAPVAVKPPSGKVRGARRGERRRLVDPTTCERDYTSAEFEFMNAMDHYKRDNRRPFPTWSEVLEVLHALGYRKTAKPTHMPGLSTSHRGSDEHDID